MADGRSEAVPVPLRSRLRRPTQSHTYWQVFATFQVPTCLQRQVVSRYTGQICFSHALQHLTRGDKSGKTAVKESTGHSIQNVDRIFKARQRQDIQRETATGYSKRDRNKVFKARQQQDIQTQGRTGYSKKDMEIFMGMQDRHRFDQRNNVRATPNKMQETTFIGVAILWPNREERQPPSGGRTGRGGETKITMR